MRAAFIIVGMIFVAMPTLAHAKPCADPPRSKEGRCAKENDGYCRSDGKWWTYNMPAYRACLAGKATKVYGYKKKSN